MNAQRQPARPFEDRRLPGRLRNDPPSRDDIFQIRIRCQQR